MQSEWTIFAVGDEPYCLWETGLAERTREFLDGLDADFFHFVLDAYVKPGEEKRASVAIHLALHHATETLFSLLGAFLQAPQCPYAWIAKCSSPELREVVSRISTGDSTLTTRLPLPAIGWAEVAILVCSAYEPGTESQVRTAKGFGEFWSRLAQAFVEQVGIDEYNALKHGFRTQPGGFKLSLGTAEKPGVPAGEMTMVGESPYGAMFFEIEKLPGNGGRHIRSRQTAVNWSLQRDVLLMQLVYMSINNVISALKSANNVPPRVFRFLRPGRDEDFSAPWAHSPGVHSATFNWNIRAAELPHMTKAEILRRLRTAQSGDKS